MPKTDFATQKAEAQAAVEKLHAAIATGVQSEGDWKGYLKAVSGLHSYSPVNTMWLMAQWSERRLAVEIGRALQTIFTGAATTEALPASTAFGAFSLWEGKGGQIRKGEKHLTVIAPVYVNDIDPKTKKPRLTATGKPAKKLIGFKLIHRTFEVSQFDGVEIPEPVVAAQDESPEGLWDKLVAIATGFSFTVSVVAESVDSTLRDGADGYCTLDGSKRIVVKAGMSPAHSTKTLAHEVAHMLLHTDGTAPANMPYKVMEIEAESVAFVVCDAMGLTGIDYSIGYVGFYSRGNGALMTSTIDRVVRCATAMITSLESGECPKVAGSSRFKFEEDASAPVLVAA